MHAHRLVKRLTATGAATLAAVAIGALGAPPATAATSDCLPNSFCMWDDSSYRGRYIVSPAQNISNVGTDMNDRMTSYWNRTDQWITVYGARLLSWVHGANAPSRPAPHFRLPRHGGPGAADRPVRP